MRSECLALNHGDGADWVGRKTLESGTHGICSQFPKLTTLVPPGCSLPLCLSRSLLTRKQFAPSSKCLHGTGGWCLAGMANERERER